MPRQFKSAFSVGGHFNRWEPVSFVRRNKSSDQYWLCRCDCGTEKTVLASSIKNGSSRSCGCLAREIAVDVCKRDKTTHGMYRSAEYRSWKEMRGRCMRTDHHQWGDYGGRGITICERWSDFATFYADMGAKPSRKHTLDRIENDGNYEPGNCQWATRKEQNRNRRSNVWVDYGGKRMILTDACILAGLNYKTVANRIYSGLSSEEALSRPLRVF